MGAPLVKKPLVNSNLISLKCVLFLFYAGLGCLHPYLQKHMTKIGLNYEESQIVSIIAPLVAIFGPLCVAPLADKIAGRNGPSYGRRLRFLSAFCMIVSVILYALLFFAVPSVERHESSRSLVSFACDSDGAVIFQKRCNEDKTCYQWRREKIGALTLTNCSYTCQKPVEFQSLYNPWMKDNQVSSTENSVENDYDSYDELVGPNSEGLDDEQRKKREIEKIYVEPPHICKNTEDSQLCHAFTADTKALKIQATLRSALNLENDTHSAEWCKYPLDGFSCNVPLQQQVWMKLVMNTSSCTPMVECEVHDPYDSPGSVLAESVCIKVIGDADLTFWSYIVIRSIADAFPLAAITLLNAATIIATRETSKGRGDFGRQIVWGAVGWSLPYFVFSWFAETYYGYLVLATLAAIVLLFANGMPLTPPEMWWHTKCGMVAVPMSAIRKYGPETAGLCLVTLILGTFWSVLDNYEGVIVKDFDIHPYSDSAYGPVWSVFVILSAIVVFPILWYAEKIVDYCGHSNILIVAITTFIFRFTLLASVDIEYWRIVIDFLYPVTLGLTWLTIVFYMRHIVPRRIITTGQALPVIAHFCFGRCFGALIGTRKSFDTLIFSFQMMALAGCVIAVFYFMLYHFLLAPRCGAKLQPAPSATALDLNNDTNNHSNGIYQPLRVYHNNRGRKGHFRY